MKTGHVTSQMSDLTHAIGPDGLLALSLPDGYLRIRAHDGDEVRIRAAGDETLEGFDIERGERSLSVRWRNGSPWSRRHAPDLQVDTPAGTSLVVEVASADVDIDGIRGDQRLRSAAGDLRVSGAVGSIAVESMSGDVEVIASAELRVDARTVSGDLGIRAGIVRALRLATTSGDLRVTGKFEGSGPFSIESVSGDTVLAPAGGVRLQVRTIAGDIRSERQTRSEGKRGQRTLIIDDGGPTIDIRSTSGDVAVVPASALSSAGGFDPAMGAPARPAVPEPPIPPRPPIAPEPVVSSPSIAPVRQAPDEAHLEILRALERGDIDIAEATRRLDSTDDRSTGGEHHDA